MNCFLGIFILNKTGKVQYLTTQAKFSEKYGIFQNMMKNTDKKNKKKAM